MDKIALARALFAAFETGDDTAARALCAPDIAPWQNVGAEMTLDSLLRFAGAIRAVVPDFRYECATCVETPKGFVEEHRVCGTLPDGTALNMPVCVVATVEDGTITELREYLDGETAAGLVAALNKS